MTDGPALNEDTTSEALRALLAEIDSALADAENAITTADSLPRLDELRINYLGKKGRLAGLNQKFGQLSAEEKPLAGRQLNNRKAEIVRIEKERREQLEAAEIRRRLEAEAIDVTLPGAAIASGHLHPLERTRREMEAIFRSMGFRVMESPEIETEWINFEALNIAADHPARDMQDTFFTERGRVLRTHTSGNQIRTMTELEPPLAIISTGKVYRCDSDVTHSPMFYQTEGYLVDKNISMGHLKGVLNAFLQSFFGANVGTRFRPSFFPFTEPSAEVDVECIFCKGSGCRVCSQTGWLEVLGCGMIHPTVLRNCGIDPENWSGFAFGVGLDRFTMLKYGINNIRLLYENDLRFLTQF
ncbi:MAG: phenylalanyl-tRNA synthetase alpha chain [Candidatus Sumerlaeota bacterium]|nr:phenylalanyl-tRNA synthetase alpha chain [Candidatus Sumerlaeota bacterium]